MVLPKSDVIPGVVTAAGGTVGVRWPSHPFIQAVIQACDFPLAAPSANPSNQLSPTTAEHVRETLGSQIPLVVDGGPSRVGIESTVIDLTVEPPRVLRPGMISAGALRAALGRDDLSVGDPRLANAPGAASQAGPVLRSPGMLRKHYSPKARLVIWNWENGDDLKRRIAALTAPGGSRHFALRDCHVLAHTHLPADGDFGRVVAMGRDPSAYARAIYAELYQCDALGARLIVVEAPLSGDEWRGIADRLARACAD
jgi:L-threonylcarbamoyladenylate synthase